MKKISQRSSRLTFCRHFVDFVDSVWDLENFFQDICSRHGSVGSMQAAIALTFTKQHYQWVHLVHHGSTRTQGLLTAPTVVHRLWYSNNTNSSKQSKHRLSSRGHYWTQALSAPSSAHHSGFLRDRNEVGMGPVCADTCRYTHPRTPEGMWLPPRS